MFRFCSNLSFYFLFLGFVGEYTFRVVTKSACVKTSNGYDYIAGFRFLGSKSRYGCALECTNHSWCRGILSGQGYCRLLSNAYSEKLFGWKYVNGRNWIEPKRWKNSLAKGYQCLVKTGTGKD